MNESNLYSGSQEPEKGGLIYAATIRALMRASRGPNQSNLPIVVDDYIYVPLNVDGSLRTRHKLLRLTAYDEDTQSWFAAEVDTDLDNTSASNNVYVVYQESDYGILIGEKPVRVNTTEDTETGSNFGGLTSLTHKITDPVDNSTYHLVIRGVSFDRGAVHCEFVEFIDGSGNQEARCTIISSNIAGLIGQTINVWDVDGAAFANETEAGLVGRLIGAMFMQYEAGGYLFWRWEIWQISCPDDV